MTSRERVNKAINHEIPDKCPIDVGGTKVTGIHADLYAELLEKLGIPNEIPRVYDQFQMLARVEEPVRTRFQGDVILLENISETFQLINDNWKDWTTPHGHGVLMPGDFQPIPDENGILYLKGRSAGNQGKIIGKMPKGGYYFDRCDDPAGVRDYDDPMSPEEWAKVYEKAQRYTDEDLKKLEKTAKWMHENTDYAICGSFTKLRMTSTSTYAGHKFQDWLVRLMLEPEYIDEILGVTGEVSAKVAKEYLEAVGDYIDIIHVSTTDYGTQDRELFSPDIFRDHYVKPIKMVNDTIHSCSSAKAMYHSCGSIYHFLSYMIEAGVDIINPIQTTAANMDPERIKAQFGDKLTLWGGGMDTQRVLPNGTVEEVKQAVEARMKIMMPGGGFVFAPEHNIQADVPVENLMAMYDTVIANRNY